MILIVATRNKGKLKEIREILKDLSINLLSLDDFSDLPEIEEDGRTFRENALKKAGIISRITGYPALAEDSGLEIKALDGHPGIYSARFAGAKASDTENTKKVLDLMGKVPESKRQAQFRTVACLFFSDKRKWFSEGICRGKITLAPVGDKGFGYDPVFVPDGYKRTFAQLGNEIKNKISHRNKALKEIKNILKDTL